MPYLAFVLSNQRLFGCLLFCLSTIAGLLLGSVFFSNTLKTKEYSDTRTHYRSNRILAEIRRDILAHKPIAAAGTLQPSDSSQLDTKLTSVHYKVPNIIHYVILSTVVRSFQFTEYVSVLSALQNQQPEEIWIHCNRDPVGYWWDELVRNVSLYRLRVIHLDIPAGVGGTPISNLDHATDVAKIQVLLKYGGIYLDSDVIVIQNMDPFRNYPAVFGQEAAMKLSPAIVLAEPNSSFLQLILDNYGTDYRAKDPDYNNGLLPYKLARSNPDAVFVETRDLVAPGLSRTHSLFSDNQALLDWHRFYAIHLRFHHGTEGNIYSPEYIKPLKSIAARILKYVYYGSEQGTNLNKRAVPKLTTTRT